MTSLLPGTVVIGVDLRDPSTEAARWAAMHLAPQAVCELVHVREQSGLAGLLRRRMPAGIRGRREARQKLEALAHEIGAGRSAVTMLRGRPAAEITRHAAKVGADLIVVGTEGERRGVEALLGSTAERTLLGAAIPILLVRKAPQGPPRHILAAVDDAEITRSILDQAAAFARRFGASVTVLHIIDRSALVDTLQGEDVDNLTQIEEEKAAEMRGRFEAAVAESELADLPADSVVTVGDPRYEIISRAARERADLVLLGSKGGDISRTRLGGRIINEVVRSAPCSVLVMPHGRGAR